MKVRPYISHYKQHEANHNQHEVILNNTAQE